jgi:PhnB protein
MTVQLNPYLHFRGDAREAMEFYRSVFGGELRINTYKEYGASSDPSEDDQVMHSQLDGDHGVVFMGSDTPSHMEYTPGRASSMSLTGDDEAVLRGWYEKLAEGGSVTVPLEKSPWGDLFGMVDDRFGVTWMVNVAKA